MISEKTVAIATPEEEDALERALMAFINTFPDLPFGVPIVQYEQLPADLPAMAVSLIQGTFITGKYIYGGHSAQSQFKIVYRIKPGTSNDKRLSADELLNKIGSWAAASKPDLGEGIHIQKIERASRSALFAAYDNGDEDHQILMKLTYEVI